MEGKNSAVQHVDDATLKSLIFTHEECGEFGDAMAHVESCPDCQARLESIATDGSDVDCIGQLLGGYRSPLLDGMVASDIVTEVGEIAGRDDSAADLTFLRAPTHPEMLGRLGRYEIERVIGTGGMGVVLKAYDTDLSRPVAVKVLKPHLAQNGSARQRFVREARSAAAVVSEHVVAIHNVESDGDVPFLVMRYVSGESLQRRVDRCGVMDARQLLRVGIQAACGLAAAHEQGVIHRDVKPANILLEEGVERALLTDFGLARTVNDASLTQSGVLVGTPMYMSPEHAECGSTDARSDLFSLGATLYFAATGHSPFRADSTAGVVHRVCRSRHRPVWQVNPDIPDSVCRIIDRLLQKRPSRRYASAEVAQHAMTECLAEIQNRPAPRFERLRRLAVRGRKVIVGGLFALMAAVVLSVVTGIIVLPSASPGQFSGGDNGGPDSAAVTAAGGDLSPVDALAGSLQPERDYEADVRALEADIGETEEVYLSSEQLVDYEADVQSLEADITTVEGINGAAVGALYESDVQALESDIEATENDYQFSELLPKPGGSQERQ